MIRHITFRVDVPELGKGIFEQQGMERVGMFLASILLTGPDGLEPLVRPYGITVTSQTCDHTDEGHDEDQAGS